MNKIQNKLRFTGMLLLIFSTSYNSYAQDSLKSPPVVSERKEYKRTLAGSPGKKMIELRSEIPNLVYDLRYATENNFMHRYMYPKGTNACFLRKDALDAIKKIQDTLARTGYGLKIFDAYRPYSVTVKFWELVKDERYVANPAKGSGHNRGIAVDLTIVELNTGKELDMGTGFDNFSDTAHHGFTGLPSNVLANRMLLRKTMESAGFRALETEWWHYFLPESNRYELLDIPFRKLGK